MQLLMRWAPVRWVMAARSRQWGAGAAALAAIGLVVLLVAVTGGGGGKPTAQSPAPQPPSTTSSTPTPTPTHKPKPALPAINPLTGLKPSNNKVIAVKIDDTAGARPQVGLDQADIVYIEQVEGGLTRLVAVFNSRLPTRVGPVRSTRNDDPMMVAQYGRIIYVASGGSPEEYRPLDRSDLHKVINDRGGPGFSRDPGRPIPLNLFSNLALVAKKVNGPKAQSIGLNWSPKITNPAHYGKVIRTTVGGTPVVFKWSKSLHQYVRYFAGRIDRLVDGRPVSTPNVIVQFVHGHVFPQDIDPAGNPAWYQRTIGGGDVVVFRDGKRIVGHWSRPRLVGGTHLVDLRGKPITLTPGGAWFVLVNNGTALAH